MLEVLCCRIGSHRFIFEKEIDFVNRYRKMSIVVLKQKKN